MGSAQADGGSTGHRAAVPSEAAQDDGLDGKGALSRASSCTASLRRMSRPLSCPQGRPGLSAPGMPLACAGCPSPTLRSLHSGGVVGAGGTWGVGRRPHGSLL